MNATPTEFLNIIKNNYYIVTYRISKDFLKSLDNNKQFTFIRFGTF